MREIKFRAWDKEKNLMVYDFDQESAEKWGLPLGRDIHKMVFNVGLINDSLMQYTGLKDKSGKEIYEGDIVKTQWRNQTGLVKWAMGGFALKNGIMVIETLFTLRYNKWEFEVMGNKFENPELLEVK